MKELLINVTVTIDDKRKAENICRKLLEDRLVACAQIIGPITSIYRWRGNIEETEEWQMIFKTRKSLFKRLENTIRSLHHYEVPEIISVDIDNTLAAYGAWVMDSTEFD